MAPEPVDVVVVGQTPPPYHGQATMIERLLRAPSERLRLHHARMAYSRDLPEVGRFALRKVVHLFGLIRRVRRLQAETGARLLYYPPAGPHRVALYRDILFLLAVRRRFAATVYHFHAGGLSELGPRLTGLERWICHRAYDRPACAILLSELNPPDGAFVRARQQRIVPYGIEDHVPSGAPHPPSRGSREPVLLYAGAITEAKGITHLLDASAALAGEGMAFRLRLMGAFRSSGYEVEVRRRLEDRDLGDRVELTGELVGEAKLAAFADADLFCFPTVYPLETFGVVLLEAMRASLPVVATRWRAIPSIVVDGETGSLVPPGDPAALARSLGRLLRDQELRRRLGSAGRRRFEERYRIDRWYTAMEEALLAAANDPGGQ